MSTVAEPEAIELIQLFGISWDTYERLLLEVDEGAIRLTYDEGDLEIMSPSRKHERLAGLIARLVCALTEELGIPISTGGSTTLRRKIKLKGLEPDQCFHVAHELEVRGRDDLDPEVDPPPDLAIEVEVSRRIRSRMGIYAALGVLEVWRVAEGVVHVMLLGERGEYGESKVSAAFPMLPIDRLNAHLARRDDTDETSWVRAWRAWVRAELAAK